MITCENGLFSIQTEHYSYLFRVNSYGLLEHLYFGATVGEDLFCGNVQILADEYGPVVGNPCHFLGVEIAVGESAGLF